MNLLDHFRPPLSARRHWHSFHSGWSTFLASHLNEQLPEGYFAEPNVQFGIEIDVATFEEGNGYGSTVPTWNVPAPTQTLAVSLLGDVVEVLVFNTEGGPTLAGAIELVSPANKDRPEHRDAFVSKCASYVQQGIGLMIVDVVTERTADLHGALVSRLNAQERPASAPLYAASYRLVERNEATQLDLWHQQLSLDKSLPVMPLWLRGSICLQVDLQATYERTCREQRIL
jgi:hypothetical protein